MTVRTSLPLAAMICAVLMGVSGCDRAKNGAPPGSTATTPSTTTGTMAPPASAASR